MRLSSIDDAGATHAAALLMTMDGMSAEPVRIELSMPEGSAAGVSELLDVLEAMRAPVSIRAALPVSGAGALLLALHPGIRSMHQRATMNLRLQRDPATAHHDLARAAEVAAALRVRLTERLIARSNLDAGTAVDHLDRGQTLGSGECLDLGLIDEIES